MSLTTDSKIGNGEKETAVGNICIENQFQPLSPSNLNIPNGTDDSFQMSTPVTDVATTLLPTTVGVVEIISGKFQDHIFYQSKLFDGTRRKSDPRHFIYAVISKKGERDINTDPDILLFLQDKYNIQSDDIWLIV